MARGLFVGLTTVDCIYEVERVPDSNEKLVAQDCLLVAGGPATNAAVAFRHLGNEAVVLSAVGHHPMTSIIRSDLEEQGVAIADCLPTSSAPPPLSTILVTQSTGDRAVVSRNALDRQVALEQAPQDLICPSVLDGIDVVLIDGHQMQLSHRITALAKERGIPVVVDGGSWKAGFETVMAAATCAITATKFRAPSCRTPEETLAALRGFGAQEVAMTFGEQPIRYQYGHRWGEVPVQTIAVKDTLGAGDFFHGAFCHYYLHPQPAQHPFPAALGQASVVAGLSCQLFGTRRWLQDLTQLEASPVLATA